MDFNVDGSNPLLDKQDETLYRNINFVKNSIYNLVDVFFNININKKLFNLENIEIPNHWNLSDRHKMDIKNFINQYYDYLPAFFGIESINTLFKNLLQELPSYINLINNTPFYSSIILSQQESINSMLDYRTCKMLNHYYFLSVIYFIFQQSSKNKNTNLNENEIEINIDDNMEIQTVSEDILSNDNIEQQIIQGEIKDLQEKVGDFVGKYLLRLNESKKYIDVTEKMIKENIQRVKDKERDDKVKKLGDLTIEAREVENLFKKHKLEKWGIGLQKGLVTYEKQTYDEELKQLESTMINEKKLDVQDYVSDMNREIYMMELDENERSAHEIENEELNMEDIIDDDDNSDRDDYEYGPDYLEDEDGNED
jgi:hypothetical protein